MTSSNRVVLPGETIRWAGRPRLPSVLPAVLAGLALVVGAVAVFAVTRRPLPLTFVPVGLGLGGWAYLVVTNTRFLVTDRAVYRKRGVCSRTVRRIDLANVQNSRFSQGVRGSLFGYGTVVVEAAGGGAIRFHDVADPRDVRAVVDRRANRVGDPVGSVETWNAVLAEVSAWRTAIEASRS